MTENQERTEVKEEPEPETQSPHMSRLITLAKQQGIGIDEIKTALPTKLMVELKNFFLGHDTPRKNWPQRKKKGAKIGHNNKLKARLKPAGKKRRNFGGRPITDTLTLRKRQNKKKKKEAMVKEQKKNKQFRLFGISFGGND